MSVDAFQYAPDKRSGLAELFRVLRPGGALAFIAFEVDPSKVTGLPVLGVDPVPDYVPLLQDAGFSVEICEETPGWQERVYGAFGAIIESSDAIEAEMSQHGAAGPPPGSDAHRPAQTVPSTGTGRGQATHLIIG